jgi:ribonuclease R
MKGKTPGLMYRIHDVPKREKIKEFAIFVKALGYSLKVTEDGEVTAKDLNSLLTQVSGKAEEGLVKTAAVRSMSKAIYSTLNVGHFGLAFEYYTHFTSPIRRYPDLLVHRILFKYINNQKISEDELAYFEKMAAQSTEREIAAADAERTSIKYKQVEYMMNKVGQEFEGIISGVTEWGIYVEESETKSEGMVRLKDMTDDLYTLDEKNYAVLGQKTKKKYTLGDRCKIKITKADLERKTLDYIFVD